VTGRRVAIVVVVVLAVTLARAASGTGNPAGGGTTVSVSGDTVDIHVNIDVIVAGPGALAGRDVARIAAESKAVADLWNAAFEQYQYGCLTLHLDLTMNPVLEGRARYSDESNGGLTYPMTGSGHHTAVWLAGDQSERPTVWDPFASGSQERGDYTSPYSNPLPATWNDQLLTSTALAHEVGHYMGLGDDYVDNADGSGTPLPGRDGTLMDDGTRIDQNLVDRLGATIAKAGYHLPTCKVWEGPLHLDASIVAKDANDQGTGDGTIRVTEDDAGRLHGILAVHTTSGCDLAPGKKSWRIRVVGRATTDTLTIRPAAGEVPSQAEFGEEAICGFPDGFVADPTESGTSAMTPIVAHIQAQTSATGSGSLNDDEQRDEHAPSTFEIKTRYTLTLERKSH
jgi:hypothetical protein